MRLGILVAAALTAACGRIGYDAPVDIDAVDSLAACPGDMLPLCADALVCIEIAERGYTDWVTARDTCQSLGRRLCSDAEWALGCTCEPALTEMYNDGAGSTLEWEWLLEESGGVAWKRGYQTCDSTSTHPITDSYDYRCCSDR